MIGLLGGTFDPVHYGHLRLALEVSQQLQLEEMRLLPLSRPAHKKCPVATPEQRCSMLKAALSSQTLLQVDDRELHRPGVSYTVDTLDSLRRDLGDHSLCLVLGSDAYAGMPEWHQADRLAGLTHLVVVKRPGDTVSADVARELGFHAEKSVDTLNTCRHGCALYLSVPALEISSSAIRALIKSGQDPRYLLPDNVLDFINEQGLYH